MLTETYIEALLVDEELAYQVWEAWDADETDDQVAWLAWWLIAGDRYTPVSGHQADTMSKGRYRPKADAAPLYIFKDCTWLD